MGYDISNHPVDVQFLQQRLIPAVMGHGDFSDFLDRAAERAIVAHRANRWALRTLALNSAIFDRQLAVAPAMPAAAPAGGSFWSRLRRQTAAPAPARLKPATGLPGFDSDLSVWGRPFFVTAREPDEAIRVIERYMTCAGSDVAAIDAIAAAEFDRLEARRGDIRGNVAREAVAVLAQFYPLSAHLPAADAPSPIHPASVRDRLRGQFDLLRTIWEKRQSDDLVQHALLDDPLSGRDLAVTLPQAVIGLAAQALPGWMGRGYVWPTELFAKIGVPVGHVFETPEPLFAAMTHEFPELRTGFSTTIRDNYSLGGYVRPQNVSTLKALLMKHRRELILAWSESKAVDEREVEAMSADFTKILEPVLWAEQKGYGFIEASEVYSGFMGVMN